MQQVITCSGVERLRMQEQAMEEQQQLSLGISSFVRMFNVIEEKIRHDIGTDRPGLVLLRKAIAWLDAGHADDTYTTEDELHRLKRLWRLAPRDRVIFELRRILDGRRVYPATVDVPIVMWVAAAMLHVLTDEVSSHLARKQ